MSCDGDDSETPDNEGGREGQKIVFRVNNTNSKYRGNASWKQGMFTMINITSPNHQPSLSQIGQRTATVGSIFELQPTATDQDNDTLRYSLNTTEFYVNSDSGVMNFTPVASQIGNHSLNMTASDGFLEAHEVFMLKVVPAPFCGDSLCYTENCLTCPTDCGSCPVQPGSGSGQGQGSGGGGQGMGTGSGSLSSSSRGTSTSGGAGQQDSSGSGSGSATTSRSTGYSCIENWACTEWSECREGQQSRICNDKNVCPLTRNKPIEKQACKKEKATCSDGIMNGDETEIDCGGSCNPCATRKYAEAPPMTAVKQIIEAGIRASKQLPWIFISVISAISIASLAAEKVYVKRIMMKGFDEYNKSLKRYKAFKRKTYKFLINLIVISAMLTTYLFYFSDCSGCILKYSYIIASLIMITPAMVSFAISKYQYSEVAKAKSASRLIFIHEMQLRKLIRIENHILLDMEDKACASIDEARSDPGISENLKEALDKVSESVKSMRSLHAEKTIDEMPKEIADQSRQMAGKLKDLSQSYAEFDNVLKSITGLAKQFKSPEDFYYACADMKDSMEKIATDKYLIEILQADPGNVKIYNSLVDIYEFCNRTVFAFSEEDRKEIAKENELMNMIEKLLMSKPLLAVLETKDSVAKVHNRLVDIHDHYKKKQSVYEEVRAGQRN
ncbi:hypothetical protein HYU11_04705 [Candidatus Woesearchaeota archaeon]|nr:hypothetical protein [Candidatus Woesearchaeota archaeon]